MKVIKSSNYFSKKSSDKIYKIITAKTSQDIGNMIGYFIKFIKLKSKEKYVGLDFEFNSSPEGKKIALFQINLESDEKNSFIYIFYPPDLSSKQTDVLISLLTEPMIKKILHGAESLDIPYLFKNIFINNKLRNKFCHNLFDTRYMCEFFHLENDLTNKKCKIYSLLLEMKVINQKQYDMLIKNEEEMGPIYLIDIDINKLNENTMLYSAFDVLYLPELLKKFPDNFIYQNLIPEITCFNYIDRYENIFTKPFSEVINKINNYFMKVETIDQKLSIKLIDIFQLYFNWVDDSNKILSKLMEINYFKKFIDVFIKFVVYKEILKKYQIYENSDTKETIYPELMKVENTFKKVKLTKYFEEFFSNIRKIIRDDINTYANTS